jgi:hypothetical protein
MAQLHNSAGLLAIQLDAATDTYGARAELYDTAGILTVQLNADDDLGGGGGIISLHSSTGVNTIEIDADESNSSALRLNDSTGSTKIGLDASQGTGGGAQVVLSNSLGDATIVLDADISDTSAIVLKRTNGTTGISLSTEFGGVGGDSRIITDVLEIRGGADLSEQFDVKASQGPVKPGMVVCIDPFHPGKLVVSRTACDRTVAGIVSGAGGVKPGMLMGQSGTVAHGKYPVALTGRAYCRADATGGSIQPGDLLTTSNIPGRAMKVTDNAKAQGAIIGKAMTSLNEGKGLVLVLVSLQ